jgi:hypothetical protein
MSELDDLNKENEELKIKIVSLEFESKLNRFLADQRANTIEELLKSQTKILKNKLQSDESKMILQLVDRIKMDNEKYDDLQNFLLKSFPKALKVTNQDNQDNQDNKDTISPKRNDLSQSYIDKNGIMYAPQHIIDVTIILIAHLKKQIEDMLGESDSNQDDKNDLF